MGERWTKLRPPVAPETLAFGRWALDACSCGMIVLESRIIVYKPYPWYLPQNPDS